MDNVRDIVNGAMLPRFLNKPVSIIGKVRNVESDNRSFYIISTDNIPVKINVMIPISAPVDGWIEARGNCTGREVDADSYTIFSNEKFVASAYNELCTLLYTVPNIWKTK